MQRLHRARFLASCGSCLACMSRRIACRPSVSSLQQTEDWRADPIAIFFCWRRTAPRQPQPGRAMAHGAKCSTPAVPARFFDNCRTKSTSRSSKRARVHNCRGSQSSAVRRELVGSEPLTGRPRCSVAVSSCNQGRADICTYTASTLR